MQFDHQTLRRLLRTGLIVLALGACDDDPNGPTEPLLLGRWGSTEAQVVAWLDYLRSPSRSRIAAARDTDMPAVAFQR